MFSNLFSTAFINRALNDLVIKPIYYIFIQVLAIEFVLLAIDFVQLAQKTRLAAGVNKKTRCSSCVIILSKYNCYKQLFRRHNSTSTATSAAFTTVLHH